MFLEFSKISIEHFKTINDKLTLKLTGEKPGLRFIKGRNEDEPELGSNGAAKSSLFDALSWCLFGRTVDGCRTPDLIPWSGSGFPNVTTTIFKGNDKHTITRSTKPNELLIDSDLVSQAEIEQLLGFNFEVFKHTVLFGQDQDLFFDLEPKAKMEVFASALNLDRWELRSEAAAAEVKRFTVELEQVKNNIATSTAVLEESRNQFKEAKKRIEEWESERKSRIKDTDKIIDELTEKFEKLAEKHDKADLAADSAGTELKALNKRIIKLTDSRDAVQKEYNKAEIVLQGIKDVVAALKQELSGLGNNNTCPTCGQSLKGTALARHKKELESRIQTLGATIRAGIPKAIDKALTDAVTALNQAKEHASQFEEKEEEARTTLNFIGPELVTLDTQIKELSKQQKDREDEMNPHREQTQSLRKTITKLENRLGDLNADLKDIEADLARATFWVKGFKSVRLYLLEELLQELELVTNAMLPESGLRDWQVFYGIEKETKKGTVVHGLTVFVQSPNNKKPVRWESWSGGEQHRLRLVGALALSEVLLSHAGVNTNLEVLDEPTRNLSVEGVQDLCEFLAIRAQQLDKDIFLTGHNVIESAHFTDTITIVKERGASSYLE